MSVMRRKIAEHMVLSAHTSPHVYSVYEVNFARVAAVREARKAEYEAAGAKLTYTAFIAKVIVDALRQFPMVNASIDGANIVYKQDINLGIAVALDNGLIVPVIRKADEKNLLGLSRAINDLAARVTVGKRLSDRVYLTYSRSLSSSTRDQIILLEYDQTDRYSWLLSRNEDKTYAIELRVRRTF